MSEEKTHYTIDMENDLKELYAQNKNFRNIKVVDKPLKIYKKFKTSYKENLNHK